MADLPQTEGFLQQQLECSVCLLTFNLEARTPTALKCQHTFCKRCVDNLATKPPLTCPKCKRMCEVENLVKNFALCDVLSELCHSCQSRKIASQNLCAICLAARDQVFQNDVKQNLDKLRQEVRKSFDLSSDDGVLNKERTRAAAIIEQIQKKIQTYQNEIQKLEVRLKNKVNQLQKMNIESYAAWQHKLEVEIFNCRSFLRNSDVTTTGNISSNVSRKYLTEINNKALEFLSTLRDYQEVTPTPTEYTFVESQSMPDVGEITSSPATSSHQPISADYTSVRSVAVSGSKGSRPDEFANNGYVISTDHRYIVADTNNHRLKVYDRDLNLMFIFGEQGDQEHQFNRPTGLCVSPSGELFVSDSGNNRIKVYNKYFQLIRIIGSQGTGNGEMRNPRGLAITQTGQLLIADMDNYRVKVLGVDGSYLRSIGSRGEGPGQFAKKPFSVAVTPDGHHVLVNELWAARLLMYTLHGTYVRDITPSIPNTPEAIHIWGFTSDCQGNIILADLGNHQLIILDPLGQLTCVVGREGDQPGELEWPMSVAVNNGNIIVYERDNRRVQLFKCK